APMVASDLVEAGFAAALTNRRLTPDKWREKIARYGRDYMSLGAAEMQHRLTADLIVLQQQLEEPELWAVASRLMTLYGKTIAGTDSSKTLQGYRMAATADDRSGDD